MLFYNPATFLYVFSAHVALLVNKEISASIVKWRLQCEQKISRRIVPRRGAQSVNVNLAKRSITLFEQHDAARCGAIYSVHTASVIIHRRQEVQRFLDKLSENDLSPRGAWCEHTYLYPCFNFFLVPRRVEPQKLTFSQLYFSHRMMWTSLTNIKVF